MTGFAFDANIAIDALGGYAPALARMREGIEADARVWISRMAWIEVLSKGAPAAVRDAERFLEAFAVDEADEAIAIRAAALRRERPRLKSPDAVILASAQVHDRVLVTRNTKDFPPGSPGILVPYTL